MVSDKKRLYIALYPSPAGNGERKYEPNWRLSVTIVTRYRFHWALLVGPKEKRNQTPVPGKRYHATNNADGWFFEAKPVDNMLTTLLLLARIQIAKVEDEARLEEILRRVPVVQNDPEWRCRSWIASALQELQNDGRATGSSAELRWDVIEPFARHYVEGKIASGRYQEPCGYNSARPAWDLIKNRELRK